MFRAQLFVSKSVEWITVFSLNSFAFASISNPSNSWTFCCSTMGSMEVHGVYGINVLADGLRLDLEALNAAINRLFIAGE